ncbi:MAG TPA: DNA primase [Verrucomicrobiae bacterium]|jgi:DNA primase|nr:DNA primase [Verrucomicrobiae bacterium]
MRYEDNVIDQVQGVSNIVDVIGQYVPLKKSGRNFKACCPFHQEKTPSFMVNSEKQIYHCFGCGAGGNVFGFLMQYENLSFPEALRRLAERANITLPERGTSHERKDRSENEKIYEIYGLAADYYRKLFQHPQEGKAARDYLVKRGFRLESAQEFGLGWAAAGWKGLYEYLARKGVPESLLLKSRLINKSEKGTCYDVFRGRLMFPIHNLQGKIIAFGGRVLAGEDGPKYLNSPENPVFQKRRELFGLHLAKRFTDRDFPRIFVCEGYLDFLRLYEEGFKASVATLGTSLTEDHVTILKRFCEEVVVVYDGDKAGEAASLRGLEVMLEGGMNVKLVRMPEGHDPDDYLKQFGKEAFQKLVDSAQDFFDYKLSVLMRRYNRSDSMGLVKIINECLETLLKVQNTILLDRYFRRLSEALGVDENSLRTELRKLKNKTTPAFQGKKPAAEVPARPVTVLANDEMMLLALLFENPADAPAAAAELSEEDFGSEASRALFRQITGALSSRQHLSLPQILTRLEDPETRRKFTEVASAEWSDAEKEKALQDCLRSIKKKTAARKMEHLRREIVEAEKKGDQQRVLACTKEYQTLLQQTR